MFNLGILPIGEVCVPFDFDGERFLLVFIFIKQIIRWIEYKAEKNRNLIVYDIENRKK